MVLCQPLYLLELVGTQFKLRLYKESNLVAI